MGSKANIGVAVRGDRACFRVQGRGDCRVSDPLQQAIRRLRAEGVRTFVFDLGECDSMDSTFIGVMAGPLRRAPDLPRGGEPGVVQVCGASARLRETLEDMGIAPLLEFVESSGFDDGFEEATTPAADADHAQLARTGVEAHETLVELNPEKNAARFRDVIEFLRQRAGAGSGNDAREGGVGPAD